MERKYTKGPWKWSEDGSALHGATHIILAPGNVPGGIDKQDGWAALLGAYDGSNEESEANAKLISAAPVLLEAAQAAIAYDAAIEQSANDPAAMSSFCTATGDTLDALYVDWISKARAAIAKSLGETE